MALVLDTSKMRGGLPAKLAAAKSSGFSSCAISDHELVDSGLSANDLVEFLQTSKLTLSAVHLVSPANKDAVIDLLSKFESSQPILSIPSKWLLSDGAFELLRRDLPTDVQISIAQDDETDPIHLQSFLEHDKSKNIGLSLKVSQFANVINLANELRCGFPERINLINLNDQQGTVDKASRPLGLGDLNLHSFVRAIVRLGYTGNWLVCPEHSSKVSLSTLAADAHRSIVSLLDDVKRTTPNLSVELPALPPKVKCEGVEFVEFKTPTSKAQDIRDLFISLRFRRERQHKYRPIELWRQGGINLVLNPEISDFDDKSSIVRVCDIGLRVADSDIAMERATILGAVRYVRNEDSGELKAPAIKTVGNDLLHLMDVKSGSTKVWDKHFVDCLEPSTLQPAGLRRIDHIAQTMPVADMDSWVLWYTTTFDLAGETLVSIGDRGGVTRSQAISAPEGEVRLNLNGANDPKTLSEEFVNTHPTGGVQHLAFSTDDIFETAEILAESDFPRLKVLKSYYVELQQRFDLTDVEVERLSKFDILYDRSEGGEYFQLYSASFFGGFFVEIVQRRGGYRGFGAANATARLDAQQSFKAKR